MGRRPTSRHQTRGQSEGPAASRAGSPNGPIRTCVGCRKRRPARELIRLALTPEGRLAAATSRRPLPGRGAWVHPSSACVERARRRGGLARALRVERVRETAEELRLLLRRSLHDRARVDVRGARRAGAYPPQVVDEALQALEWVVADDVARRSAEGDDRTLRRLLGRLGATQAGTVGERARMTSPPWSARILSSVQALGAYLEEEQRFLWSAPHRRRGSEAK